MTLSPGTRLGPYEITAKLGEGGMGEVYRAHDTKLKRDVAIKVLPAAFTEDKERLARFEREAQLLAQLHHPNIASIFGMEESDGTRALVMELVEGPTLAERLEAGPFSFNECLSVCVLIAHALEEAHEKGIVHRDLKPQNIKASREGKTKVLDFGLAKAMDPMGAASGGVGSASQLAASPTLTLGATVQGVILGTAAYMAPEQAAGGAVDRRADVWSFGVVLYEMLVGRRLFDGETVSHVLAGVLKDEPDFSLLPPDVPPKIRRLLRRCLRKKPRERLQSIGDARLVLEEVLAGVDRDEVTTAPALSVSPTRAANWRSIALGGAALLALGLTAGALLLAPKAAPAPPVRLELALPAGLRIFESQGSPSVAISADGRRIALCVTDDDGHSGLLLRDLGEIEPRRIDGTEGARAPFFSPDGEWVGYFDDKAMVKVSVQGGKPTRLAEADVRSRGAVWGRDGYIYFSAGTDSAILRISEAGGVAEPVTQLDAARKERTHRWPELTPDGRTLLFTSDTAASPTFYDDARIEAVELATGSRHVVVENTSEARMLADDLLIYANGGNLFALPVDPRRLTPTGKPVALEQEVATNIGSGAVQISISRRGSAIWLPRTQLAAVGAPLWYTRDGKSNPASIPDTVPIWQLALSPDGKRVAFSGGGNGGGAGSAGNDLWIGDLERGTLARLTFDEDIERPTWSPDGRRVAYTRLAKTTDSNGERGGREIAWKPADGGGEGEVLLNQPGAILAPIAFSPDGKSLVYTSWDDAGKGDLWILPLAPLGAPRPFQSSPYEEYAAAVSPNGRWIAYLSNETGRFEAYVRPFPDGAGKWQVSPAGAYEPRWSADGRELFYRSEDGSLWSVPVESGSTFRAGTPTVLFGGLIGGRNPETYGIAPDGKRFLSLGLYTGVGGVHALDYSDEWLTRARRLLAPRR